ncbi:MAG: hypothetical protein KJO08_07610 [Gammaproteobacteria bacterium]|nr:hypothetical protein [Gammaproteobacteria bacterium]NNJ85338.1 hypothetical protein [Gammaproteobacteria bacterium]
MLDYVLATGVILFLLLGWISVQQIYRRFAEKYPELGPYRDDVGSCGSCGCGTGGDSCSSDEKL